MSDQGYAGDISPDEAWKILREDADAVLVDVRTDAEWGYVGLPDLAAANKNPARIPWKIFPKMAVNEGFVDAVTAAVPSKDAPIFFLCRSGQRSRDAAIATTAKGFRRCYNILDGFEGPLDATGHRGTVAGWKKAGMPWMQS